MIVVTGSTGRVGRLVAEEVARRGEPLRLLVRDPGRAPRLPEAEITRADYGVPATLAHALRPGDRVFMVSIWIGGQARLDLHRGFVEAAARAGVGHGVYPSVVHPRPHAGFSPARRHRATEAVLRASR